MIVLIFAILYSFLQDVAGAKAGISADQTFSGGE
jgi:hypothetical protein